MSSRLSVVFFSPVDTLSGRKAESFARKVGRGRVYHLPMSERARLALVDDSHFLEELERFRGFAGRAGRHAIEQIMGPGIARRQAYAAFRFRSLDTVELTAHGSHYPLSDSYRREY